MANDVKDIVTLGEVKKPVFQHPKFKYILSGVVFAVFVGLLFFQFGTINPLKILGPENVAISQFELTASIADSAGISPDSIFVLKSTTDLDEGVIKKYIKVEPSVEFDVDKISTGVFEIKPKEKLPENEVLAIMIDVGPIADKPFSWAYQVKAPFQVISTLPRDKGTDVPVNSGIEVVFNRENFTDPDSFFEISPKVAGRFEIHRNTLVFVPTQQLQGEIVYTVTVKGGIRIQGSDDILAEDKVFKFETARVNYNDYSSFNFDRTFWEFKPDIEPAFEVSYYQIPNVSNLPAKVYRFNNVDEFINAHNGSVIQDSGWSRFSRYRPYQGSNDKKVFDGKLSVENQLNINFIRLPQKLNEGYYLIDVLVKDEHRQSWFQITDLANYSAVSGTQSLIWLRSLAGNQPVNNAEIFFEGNNIGKTNSDGVAQFNTPQALILGPENGSYNYYDVSLNFYVIKAQGKEVAIPVTSAYGGSKVSPSDQWWDYLSFDKTIYQPNDTLRFWGVVKQRNGTDVKGEELVMQLTEPFWYGTSPNDTTVYAQAKANVSDFYTVTGEMNFSGLKPGMYQLSIKRGNEVIISENINIEAYVKPAYRLILTPDKNAVFAGDVVNFKVRAEFFDGTPVSNLQIKYTGYFDDQIQGNLRLNNEGEGSFNVKTNYTYKSQYGSVYWPRYLGLTVSPTMSEEGEIAESSSVLVFGPEIDLGVSQSRIDNSTKFQLKVRKIILDKIEQGQPFWVSGNYLGDSVANQLVNVDVIEIIHKSTETGRGYDVINKTTYPIYTYSREEKSIRKDTLTTDTNGEANFEQSLEKEKTYKIIFTTKDSKGRVEEVTRYAYGGQISIFDSYQGEGISLKNLGDKNTYKIGEKISVQAQDNNGNELSVSGRNFMFYRVVGGIKSYHVSDNPNFEDTFKDEYIPNINIVAVWFSGNRFHDSWSSYYFGGGWDWDPGFNRLSSNFSFETSEKKLNITVKRDKDRYKPGEEVNLDIEVRDKDGRPKEAEVNISALDEAVFALNPEEKDITNNLYKDVSTSILTRSSHFMPIQSGAEGGGCFLAGTDIITASGNKSIEDIRIGDYIITRTDDASDQFIKARVRRTTAHLVEGYLVINNHLKVTGNHRIFANDQWIKAGQIKVGDFLLNSDSKKVPVNSVEEISGWNWVYNFEVEDQHTYFADSIYVHNEEKGGGEARGDFKDVAIYKSIKTGSNGKGSASFKLPDNITSWRLSLQAISKDWFAGKSTEFIPVGLPFFVDATLNRTYLTGDNLILRNRIFGTANVSGSINYKVESGTLPFKSIEKGGSKIEELDLGQLTPGTHQLKISANSGNLGDAIIKEIEVVDSYFTRSTSQYYDVSSGLLNIAGNAKGFTKLLFTSQERGKLYSPLLSFLWSYGARVDQAGGRYFADVLLKKFFEEDRSYDPVELRSYQTQSGGIALLPYSDDDLAISAKFADLIKDEEVDISRDALKEYFYRSLNDKKTDLSRVVTALYGLAALREPVLVTLQNIKDDSNLTLLDKAYVALAIDTIGAKEEARKYYQSNFKPKFIIKQPYIYIEELKSKDDNIVLTAMLANLAGSLKEAEASSLFAYAFENRPQETLINFEILGYIKKFLPNLKGGEVSFTYRTNQKSETKKLEKNESFRLVLDAENLAALRFENIDGQVGLVSFYDETVSPEQLKKDNDITLRRTYSVDGRPTIQFKEGDLVKIEITPTYSGKALPGLYQITDYLPSGLRAVSRLNVVPYRESECVRYPSVVEDQKVTFLDWNYTPKYCSNFFYYARVVTKGSYKAEPTIIQSFKNLGSQNISNPAPVIIK